MANINYKDLGLSTKTDHTTFFKWGDKEIEILDYLPADSRYDVVMITLQKSLEDGIYNPIKLNVYFHLNLVYIYTNLVFSAEDREDEFKLYDELVVSGFLDEFLKHIDADDYADMQHEIEEIAMAKMQYGASAANFLRTFVDDLPGGLQSAQQIVDNFNPEKYQAVIDFAKAANGGRPIK